MMGTTEVSMKAMLAMIDRMDEELKLLGQQITLASLRRRLLSEKRAALLEKVRVKAGKNVSRVRVYFPQNKRSGRGTWKLAGLGFLSHGPAKLKHVVDECTRQVQLGVLQTKVRPGDKDRTAQNVSQMLNAAKKSGEVAQGPDRLWRLTGLGAEWLESQKAA